MKLQRMFTMALVLLSMTLPQVARAQEMQPLPIDPAVRMGRLDNGLTYIIRHNEYPKDRAEFYIAQRVGSILEEENQRGLAHFLEHMCFNGTKNFPDKALISYLEANGMRFGYNINAYTGIDETVYTLMDAPSTRSQFIDSCLLILHDWSGFVTLADQEIDKERGVITEEWRSRDNASMRMLTTALPKIYPNSRYGERMPIGLMSVVNGFKYKELRDYYHKWYRPDLQAIIVVGDINVDEVEQKIKTIFADIPAPVNAAERKYFTIEDNVEPLVAIERDKEATSTELTIMFKGEKIPRELSGTMAGVVYNYTYSVINHVMSERFNDIMHQPNPPFASGGAYIGNFFLAKVKDAFSFQASVREGEFDRSLKALVTEIERVRQYGITAGEYERARINILKGYEDSYNERETRKNKSYADEYVSYFTDGGYIPGIEMEKTLIDQLAKAFPVDAINQMVKEWIGDQNMVVLVMAPDKKGLTLPSETQIVKQIAEYRKLPVEPIKDQVSDMKLMEQKPKAGQVTKQESGLKFDVTRFTLSNGMVVYLKTTDFKKNSLSMTAIAKGGVDDYLNTEQLPNLRHLDDLIEIGGVAQFDLPTLRKALTGRSVGVSGSMGVSTVKFSGSTTLEDMDTFFQLLHLRMTQPRVDQDAFTNWRTDELEQLKNMEANPMQPFQDSLIYALYNNNPLMVRPKAEEIQAIDYQRVMSIWKERISDLGGLQLFFIGNVTADQLKPYLEQYVASISTKSPVVHKMHPEVLPQTRKESLTIDFKKELATPMAMVFAAYTGKLPYTLHNTISMELLSAILDQVYTATVREDEGGTYGVSSSGSISRIPEGESILQIFYQTAPEKVDALNKIIYAELQKIAKEGVNKEMFDKAILNMKKEYEESVKNNGYWLSHMVDYFFWDKDFETAYVETLNKITPADVQKLLQEILKQNHNIEVIIRHAK